MVVRPSGGKRRTGGSGRHYGNGCDFGGTVFQMRSRSGIVLNLSGHGILRPVARKRRVVSPFVFGNPLNGDDGNEGIRMTRFRSETVFHTGNAFRNDRGNIGHGSGNGRNVSNVANHVNIV